MATLASCKMMEPACRIAFAPILLTRSRRPVSDPLACDSIEKSYDTELVEVMDGHSQQHQPRVVGRVHPVLLPGLAGAHVDRGCDELPEETPVDQLAAGADGRVPASVLVDRQRDASAFGCLSI